MEKLYDTLMVSALDEPDSIYCALAQSVTMSADSNSFTFQLRPEARFSTGEPVTARDVAFTYDLMKREGHPSLMILLSEVDGVEAVDTQTVTIRFSGRQTVPAALGAMSGIPILSAAFLDGKDFTRTGMQLSLIHI